MTKPLGNVIVALSRFNLDRVVVDRTQWTQDDLRVDNVRPTEGPSVTDD